MNSDVCWVDYSLRVPGLGVLVVPTAAAPAWLVALPLQAGLRARLHCPGHAPLALFATREELSHAGQPPTPALLLDADPAAPVGPGAWLELVEIPPEELLY